MTSDKADEYYLTVAEVADLLRLNQQTVRNWIDQGSLPALRVGRRVRIKRSDFDQLISSSYSGGSQGGDALSGPSAEDFWGGEPVGVAEPAAGGTPGEADGTLTAAKVSGANEHPLPDRAASVQGQREPATGETETDPRITDVDSLQTPAQTASVDRTL